MKDLSKSGRRIWRSVQEKYRYVLRTFDAIKSWRPADEWRQRWSFSPSHRPSEAIPIGLVPEPPLTRQPRKWDR